MNKANKHFWGIDVATLMLFFLCLPIRQGKAQDGGEIQDTSKEDSPPSISFIANSGCNINGLYCLDMPDDTDHLQSMNSSEIEEQIEQYLVNDLGISYDPFISATVENWAEIKNASRVGYNLEEGDNFNVRAIAMGVMITSVSNIDSVQGTFEASFKIRFYDLLPDGMVYKSLASAHQAIYKTDKSMTTATTLKDHTTYFKKHSEDLPMNLEKYLDKHFEEGTEDVVHPDGICSPSATKSMKPILAKDFDISLLRMPHLNAKISPSIVKDDEGYLRYVEILGAKFRFKPINREYFPVQIDLLDIMFEMGSIDLIDEDQIIAEYILCLHSAYSGFSNHVFGSDKRAGHQTSNSLTMVPYLTYDFVEPYLSSRDQYIYDSERQDSVRGTGNRLQRELGLRVIVENELSYGWYKVIPFLFTSFAALANFISSDPEKVNGTTMIQALLGVNSLVTQNSEFVGTNSVMGKALLLTYVINGFWISTVVIMMLINQNKKKDKESSTKWYMLYQIMIFRYLRLLAVSLCLIYIPLITAYSIDKSNGKQNSLTWVWAVVISFIMLSFIGRAFIDYRNWKKRKVELEEEETEALVPSNFSKPMKSWNQEEVLCWINTGSMHQESYFSDSKRSSIADKLEAACISGELLCDLDVEHLVQLVGLPYGDSVMLGKEVAFFVGRSSNHQLDSSVVVGGIMPEPEKDNHS